MSTTRQFPEVSGDAPKAPLPESPFVGKGMAPGRLCVKSESFVYKGLISIPKNAERPSTAGIIVDLADDVAEMFPESGGLQRGDRILYSQFAGYMFNFKHAAGMRIMGRDEILGKLKQEVEIEDE